MKLRIRVGIRTVSIELENKLDATVDDLKNTILRSAVALHLRSDFQLSLNKQTVLDAKSNLSELGVVSGDLIYILQPLSDKEACVLDNCLDSMDVSRSSSTLHLATSADATAMKLDFDQSVSHSSDTWHQGNEISMATDKEISSMELSSAAAKVNEYLNEPMLIRESTDVAYPFSLLKFYSEAKVKDAYGALAVLLKILMNELGFMEENNVAVTNDIKNWSNGQAIQIIFCYPALENSKFSLLLIPMHKTLFIHGFVQLPCNSSLNLKLSLTVSDFVASVISGIVCETYQGSKLSKLSRTFKDVIAYPLLQFALAGSGFCVKASLSTLVAELQIAIFKLLDVTSLLHLSEVSSNLNAICKDRAIWKHLFSRDFGAAGISVHDLQQDWRQMYKETYLQRKKMKAAWAFYSPPIVPTGGEPDLFPFIGDPRNFSAPFDFLGRRPFSQLIPDPDLALHLLDDDHLERVFHPAPQNAPFSRAEVDLPFRF